MGIKTLEEYLQLPYTIEVIRDNNPEYPGWVARVVELPGCMTQADTFDELGEMVIDAMSAWIGTAIEDGQEIPEPRPQESYSGKFIVRVPRSLHRMLVETADKEGVSLNGYVSNSLALSVGQSVKQPKVGQAEGKPELAVWSKISASARRLLMANGYYEDLHEIDETHFAEWIDDCLDQARIAMERSEFVDAQKFILRLKNSLVEMSAKSPLIRTYHAAITMLEMQLATLIEMQRGLTEYDTFSSELGDRRICHQTREKGETSQD